VNKQYAAQKILKLIALRNNFGATEGEKNNASLKILEFCDKYHLRLEGNLIIDTDIEEENKKKQYEAAKKLQEVIEPEKSNLYVIYKGKKYYARPGQRRPAVPREVYIKQYLRG
jgi:hypothetical protein